MINLARKLGLGLSRPCTRRPPGGCPWPGGGHGRRSPGCAPQPDGRILPRRHKLLPAAHAARVPLGAELANQPLKVAPWNKFENLTEQAAKWTHVESPLCLGRYGLVTANLTRGGSTTF